MKIKSDKSETPACGRKPTIWLCKTSRPGWWAVQGHSGCRDALETMARSRAAAVAGWNAMQSGMRDREEVAS